MSYNLKQSTPKILYYKINTEETKFQNKIKNPSQKSTKMVNIRVTDEELLEIENKSKMAGMSKTDFIKKAVKEAVIYNIDSKIVEKIVVLQERINQLEVGEKKQANQVNSEFNSIKDDIFKMLGG